LTANEKDHLCQFVAGFWFLM